MVGCPNSAAKVSIVGVGSVGTAIAYACMIRGSAGAIALYDIAAKKVHAEVLDLNHGSQFVPNCTVTGSDSIDVTAGSSIVIVTAGRKQKPGQSRLELAATNVAMAQTTHAAAARAVPRRDHHLRHQPGRHRHPTPPLAPSTSRRAGSSAPERCWTPAVFATSSPSAPGWTSATCTASSSANTATPRFRCGRACRSAGCRPLQWRDAAAQLVFDDADPRGDRQGRGERRLRDHRRQGRDQPRDRPVQRADHRGGARRPAAGAADLDRADRRLRTHRRRAVAADAGVAAGAGQVLEVPLSVNELLGLQASAATLRKAQESLDL